MCSFSGFCLQCNLTARFLPFKTEVLEKILVKHRKTGKIKITNSTKIKGAKTKGTKHKGHASASIAEMRALQNATHTHLFGDLTE